MKCVKCNTMLKFIKNMPTNLDGGVEVILEAYYGSRFDGDRYSTVMCDNCFESVVGEEE